MPSVKQRPRTAITDGFFAKRKRQSGIFRDTAKGAKEPFSYVAVCRTNLPPMRMASSGNQSED